MRQRTALPRILALVAMLACQRTSVKERGPRTPAPAPTTSSADTQASAGLATSAGKPTAADDSSTGLHFHSAQDSICGEVAENGFKIPDSDRRAVAAQFGRPDSVRTKPAPNPHRPAQIDTVVDVFYPGLHLLYWAVNAAPPYDILLEADVSDNRYLKFPQFGIGATTSEITSALGPPHQQIGDTYRYSCAMHVMSGADVSFHFTGGRVTRIDYRWEAD